MTMAEAVAMASENLVYFRRILLICGNDEVKAAKYHFTWSDVLLNKKENYVIEGYRESAKTQYVLRAFPLYCLTFPDQSRDYIVIIKNNATLAGNKLKEIENEYKNNPAISANCVKIHEESTSVFSVDVKNPETEEIVNVRIEAYGKGASIRGLSNIDRRPKVVIIDDPQDLEDARSDTVTESDWQWFLSDVKFLGQFTRIFMIGNNLGERCLVERVMDNAKELGFITMKIPVIIEGESAWPEKNTLASIKIEQENYRKIGQIDVWLREKMCQAVGEETRIFKRADFRYFPVKAIPKLIAGCSPCATLDPASSKSTSSCYRAITINFVDPNNRWQIVDVPYGRWDSAQLIDIMFDKVIQWKLKEFGIEKGQLKDVIEPFIYKDMARRNIFFDIIPLEHAKLGSKLERIKMLQPRFKAHLIWFPDYAEWLPELESELLGVTKDEIKSLYIDLVDSLAMQEQIAKIPYNSAEGDKLPREAQVDQDPLANFLPNRRLPRTAIVS